MTQPDLGFAHRFVPAPKAAAARSPRVLLLLHGTGGDEDDLLPLGQQLAPSAHLLSPRGKVLEHGMPRFFRRFAEGEFDEADLIQRTHELADFVEAAITAYDLAGMPICAVGYSNGANIAASMLLLRPTVLSGAILLRAQVPLLPAQVPDLHGRPVLLSAGRTDTLITPEKARALAELLQQAHADLTLHWANGGHGLTQEDITVAREWLGQHVSL